MANHLHNALLAGLDTYTYSAIEPHLRTIDLVQGRVLALTGSLIRHVYFPQTGILSPNIILIDGQITQIGMIGWDGEFGATCALNSKVALSDVSVLIPGRASVIDANVFKSLASGLPNLHDMIIRSEQFFLSQVQQTVACNTHHLAMARMCKMFLRMRNLAGEKIQLTQEELSSLLGIRRTTFSDEARELKKLGAISYARGRITIENFEILERLACECHGAVSAHHNVLFQKASVSVALQAFASVPQLNDTPSASDPRRLPEDRLG